MRLSIRQHCLACIAPDCANGSVGNSQLLLILVLRHQMVSSMTLT